MVDAGASDAAVRRMALEGDADSVKVAEATDVDFDTLAAATAVDDD
jgi:phage-related baseplate assembly protein